MRLLTKRGRLEPGSELFGKAFENWVFHELSAHQSYSSSTTVAYWRLSGGTEVDFIVNDMQAAVEAKATARVTADHLRGLREVARDHPRLKRKVLVCLEERARTTEDGIEILPHAAFAERLWSGELVG